MISPCVQREIFKKKVSKEKADVLASSIKAPWVSMR